MSQLALLGIGVGLMLGAAGKLWVIAAAAALTGMGFSVSTPSSSHLLARYSPPRYAPLIFSIKQAGVPAGGLLLHYGHRMAWPAALRGGPPGAGGQHRRHHWRRGGFRRIGNDVLPRALCADSGCYR